MVEVFATNVSTREESEELVTILSQRFPDSRINIDLEDCDKVLRIQTDKGVLCIKGIMQLVRNEAYEKKTLI